MFTLLAALLAPASLVPPETFGDWIVGCDNRRDCEAAAFVEPLDEDGPPYLGLIVSRKAEAKAPPVFSSDMRFSERESVAGTIHIDGAPSFFRMSRDGDLIGDPMKFAVRLADARAMSVVDGEGQTIVKIRTSGASAALRFMDDRQKRAGGLTAMVARGSAVASAVPKPPTLPKIVVPTATAKPPKTLNGAAVTAIRRKFDLCEKVPREPEYYRIDAVTTLGILPCWQGPYQSDGIIVLVSDSGTYRLAPIESVAADEVEVPVIERSRLIEPEYDVERRLLSMTYRGRGLNDCGENASWAWDGKTFRLASYAAMNECKGVTVRLPQWQTANDPSE